MSFSQNAADSQHPVRKLAQLLGEIAEEHHACSHRLDSAKERQKKIPKTQWAKRGLAVGEEVPPGTLRNAWQEFCTEFSSRLSRLAQLCSDAEQKARGIGAYLEWGKRHPGRFETELVSFLRKQATTLAKTSKPFAEGR